MQRETFAGISQLLERKTTDTPVFCFHPQAYRRIARTFVERFPGEVLYAVKANPDPTVVGSLVEGGIVAFDTASLEEIALVRGILPGAHCSYNHPVKPRGAITQAYREWGIRDFVVDHPAELDKLFESAGPDLVVEVRVAAPNPHATISFNTKFGAEPADAVALLREVHARGARAAICTHLGYQTLKPGAFADGLRVMSDVAESAGVALAYVNMGGGFPSALMPAGLSLDDFFGAIGTAHASLAPIAGVALHCEPGSALAHPGGSVLCQVLLVKQDAVYLNDGIYGALAELPYTKKQPPTRVLTRDGSVRGGAERLYTVFGPTCDSVDTLGVPFSLPADIREGDWLHLGMMGAYSHILITNFNGLGLHETALINDDA